MLKSFKTLSHLFNKVTLTTFIGSCSLLSYNTVLANDEMKFSWHKNCEDCEHYILASGRIVDNTPTQFSNFLSSTDTGKTVYLNSVGGSLEGGIGLGEIIRKNKINTYLGESYKEYKAGNRIETLVQNPVCYSSCAYAFLGGVKRKVEQNAKYGIHNFKNTETRNNLFQIKVVDKYIYSYLDNMGIDRDYLNLAKSFSNKEMHILPGYSRFLLNVDNDYINEILWNKTSKNRILSNKNVDNGYVNVIINRNKNKYTLTYNYILTNNTFIPQSIDKIFVEKTLFDLKIDKINFLLMPESKWIKLRKNVYQIKFNIDKEILNLMSKANEIEISPKTTNKLIAHKTIFNNEGLDKLNNFLKK